MTDKAIEAIRKEIVALTAENLAMQFVLTSLLQRIGEGNPSMRRLILQALDEAANHAENYSIVRGAKAGHLPETLRIIEQMRLMLVGKGKLKRDQWRPFGFTSTRTKVGDVYHLKVFATAELADEWFQENDPEGVAFAYEVMEWMRAAEGVNSSTLPIAIGSHLEGPNRSRKFAGIIRIGRRWFGRAHEFGLSSIRWPFHVTNNRERKREQDEKLDHHCGGYSPPTDAAVVMMLTIE
jgi:hypothetical protein